MAIAKDFQTFLTALADPNPDTRRQALVQAIGKATFGDTPQGQFLESIADEGLLALTTQLDTARDFSTFKGSSVRTCFS